MTVGVSDVDRWDPAALRTVAEAAEARAEAAEAASDVLAGIAEINWAGEVSEIAAEMIGQTRSALDEQSAVDRGVARAVARAADGVAAIKARLDALDDEAHARRLAIDRATGRVVPAQESLQARLDRLLADAAALDAELARAVAPAGRPPPPPRAAARTGVAVPGATPEAVHRWWESLSPAQRDRLITDRAADLGNLDGIPVAARDRANRAVLARDLAAGDAAAAEVREGVELNAMRTGAPTLLLTYQPRAFAGQGRAAIAIGDPDTAAHTAVLVPGTANSVTSGWLDDMGVSNLYNQMTAAGPGESMSVVAWMGYDAPDSMLDPRVATPGLARQGGALLARDVRALAVTGRDSHTTVVGHSYGSTTVADAAAGHRMPADDIVLVGSPGTDMARTAADFGVTGGVYVGSASGDPVTFLAGVRGGVPIGLGADPAAAGFGATRFKAEVPGLGWRFWDDHVRYFDTGSESLYGIAHVAAGEGPLLAERGMTAPPRTSVAGPLAPALGLPSWSAPWTDPEVSRPATTGGFDTRGRP